MENDFHRRIVTTKYKIAVAESCTGGLLGHLITNQPGSSDYFLGGILAYHNDIKTNLLGVKKETLSKYGAVSRETVLEMASGVRNLFYEKTYIDEMIGVSISGIAGPGGEGIKPVGLVWIGIATDKGQWAWRFQWQGDRIENKMESAIAAIKLMLGYLENDLPPETR
jgi:PncC family amidohydrolase